MDAHVENAPQLDAVLDHGGAGKGQRQHDEPLAPQHRDALEQRPSPATGDRCAGMIVGLVISGCLVVARRRPAQEVGGQRHRSPNDSEPRPSPRVVGAQQRAGHRRPARGAQVEPGVEAHQPAGRRPERGGGIHVQAHVHKTGTHDRRHHRQRQRDGSGHQGQQTDCAGPGEKGEPEDPWDPVPLSERPACGVAHSGAGQGDREKHSEATGADVKSVLHIGGGHRPRAPEETEQGEARSQRAQARGRMGASRLIQRHAAQPDRSTSGGPVRAAGSGRPASGSQPIRRPGLRRGSSTSRTSRRTDRQRRRARRAVPSPPPVPRRPPRSGRPSWRW